MDNGKVSNYRINAKVTFDLERCGTPVAASLLATPESATKGEAKRGVRVPIGSRRSQRDAYIFVELGNRNKITLGMHAPMASATYVPTPDLPVGCLC